MRAEIISVGDELLRGYTVNTNTAYLAKNLAELGYDVNFQTVVGDSEKDIFDAVRIAVGRSHVIIFTGGLGPTKDDMTKEMVAKALGMKLVFDEATGEKLRAQLAARGIDATEAAMKQAYVVDGCNVLRNDNGTAPGILMQKGNQAIILLPGPPREMEPMFQNSVRPFLMSFSDVCCASATVRVVGLGEPSVEEMIKDLLYGVNPHAALYVSAGEVTVRIFAKGDTAEEAALLCRQHTEKIKGVLGSYAYGEGDKELPEVLVDILKDKKMHIATAESCTGGLVSAKITGVSGSSAVFDYGITSYADWVKRHELSVDKTIVKRFSTVSAPCAGEMAKGVLAAGKADIGVGICGIAGPDSGEYADGALPVGLVYVGVADKSKVIVKRFTFGALRRESIRELAAKNALDMARRVALGIDVPDSYRFRHNELTDIDKAGKPGKTENFKIKRGIATGLALVAVSVALYGGITLLDPASDIPFYDHIRTEYANSGAAVEGSEELGFAAGSIDMDGLGIKGALMLSEDSEYYKLHTSGGNPSELGCLHLDSAHFGTDLLAADNLIIHGSSANKGRFFGPLDKLFDDEEVLRENGIISLEIEGESRTYRIFSVMLADSAARPAAIVTDFDDEEHLYSFSDFVVDAKMRSRYNIDLGILSGDRFLTLVTESDEFDGARLIVVARELRSGESADAEIEVALNPNTVWPEMWYADHGELDPALEALQKDYWANWLAGEDDEDITSELLEEPEYEQWPEIDEENDPSLGATVPTEDEQTSAPEVPKEPESNTGASLSGGGSGVVETPADSATTPPATTDEGLAQISVTSYSTGKVYTGTPVEIISMIVEAEVGSSFSREAIKAQAVATITYYKYSSASSSAPTFPLKTASTTVTQCVSEVINQGLYYGGSIIFSPYSASAAGKTNGCHEVWVQNLPYLQPVESKYDYLSSGYNRTYTYSSAELRAELEPYYEVTLSNDPANWIQIKSYTGGGYVGEVSIDGQYTTTGARLRSNCLHLRSAAFTYEYNADTDTITIVTSGYGHGVGLSQWGAHYYAVQESWTYDQILAHYYPGATLGGVSW